jgi:protein SCO1/2
MLNWTAQNRRIIRSIVAGAMLMGILLATSCEGHTKRYPLRGNVLAKNPATNEITVKHEDIPGFMPAMTMPYKVKDPAVVQEVQPGDAIAADVVTANNGNDYWLEDVRITDESARKATKPAVAIHRLEVGERVPDIPLINQDGKTFHFSDFKGKALLVTFVYTRCPVPTFCPRLSGQFAKIQGDLSKTPDDFAKTHLVTISFDPKYDTPPVLRKYGLAYLDDDPGGFSHWDFASTNAGDLRKLAGAFGLEYFEEDNQISHTMDIVLISPEGKIMKYWATEWTTAELEDALRQQAKTAPTPQQPQTPRKAG